MPLGGYRGDPAVRIRGPDTSPASMRRCVAQERSRVHYDGKSPGREHRLQLSGQFLCRLRRCLRPTILHEMYVAVLKSREKNQIATIYGFRSRRNGHSLAWPNISDTAALDQNRRIFNRRSLWRADGAAANQSHGRRPGPWHKADGRGAEKQCRAGYGKEARYDT